jgi:glycosyltransferase involved in cell wall biosynthesis
MIINQHDIELSVVVLSYESTDFIESFCIQLLNELNELKQSFEIIIVANYDHNDDITPYIAKKLEEKYSEVTALTMQKEGKMGWDMRMGLEKSSGKFIAVIDGDGQMPVSDILVVYKIIKSGSFDLVKTYRNNRLDGWYRTILSKWYNRLFNLIYRPPIKIKDVNAKPKILSKEAYTKLNLQSNDWFTDAEIMIQALQNNFKICEVATVFHKNERRASFVSLNTIFEFIVNLIKYKVKH